MDTALIPCIVGVTERFNQQNEKNSTKLESLAIWMIVCFGAGFGAYGITMIAVEFSTPFAAAFRGDITATLVIFAAGTQRRNSSMYDACWSLALVVILLYWASARAPVTGMEILLLAAMGIWGIRLRFHWLREHKPAYGELVQSVPMLLPFSISLKREDYR